jgi:osmotically-inducible protein OsmY
MRGSIGLKKLLVASALAASLAACSAMSGQETPTQYMQGAATTAKVKAALAEEPSLTSTQISVETFDDVVQLSGFVDSRRSKTKAGQIARNVEGVRSVTNDLVVRRPAK